MKPTSLLFLTSILFGSALSTPLPTPAEIAQRDLAGCKSCMTSELAKVGIKYGVTVIKIADMHKWSTAGVTCSLNGECAKGKPVSSAGSGSESDGNHKPKTKPSEVMQLAKQLRASKHMVTQDGGASDDSS